VTAIALEPLLVKLGWSNPETTQRGYRRSVKLFTPPDSSGARSEAAPQQPTPREAEAQISPPTNPESASIAEAAKSQFEAGQRLGQQGNLEAAVACFVEAIRLQPEYLAAYNQLGNAYQKLGQSDRAIATYQHLLQLNPNVAQAHCNLGAIWQMQGKTEEAIAAYQRAIQLKPDFALAHLNLGRLYVNQSAWLAAKQCFQEAVRLQPDADAYCELSRVLHQLGRTKKAIAYLETALERQPDSVTARHNLGCLWMTLSQMAKAQRCFDHVIALQPDFPSVHGNLGQALEALGQFAEALTHYDLALELNPNDTIILFQREHLRLSLCDWADHDRRLQTLQQRIEQHLQDENAPPLSPLFLYHFPVPMSLHAAVARRWADRVSRAVQSYKHLCAFTPPPDPAPKLRLGYLSADFRQHAVGTLIHQIFQHHDRDRFEVYAYSLVDTADEFTAAIQAGCDRFVNLAGMSSATAARRIHSDGIHILIDLTGYTTFSHPEILALQPAPIQVQYLGYPGTMGAEFIQYILADRWLIPPELAPHYSEQVVELPHAFVASPLEIADSPLTRADLGLPADAFVFCCFNRSDKFDPEVFATWMRILQQVPDGVLWLIETTPVASETLRQFAQQQGVNPTRLIFTPRMPLAQYLAAYRLADLFLDTFVYNAGATGIHALLVGLPIVTRPDRAFPARMGASICAAAGLESIVGDSTASYEQTAVRLATHPDELARIRRELQAQRDTLPLFQPQRWIAYLEAALEKLWQLAGRRAGLFHSPNNEEMVEVIPRHPRQPDPNPGLEDPEGSSVHFNGVELLAGNLSYGMDLGPTDPAGLFHSPNNEEIVEVHFNGVELLAGNLSSRRDLEPTDPESLPLQSPKSPSPPTIQYLPLGNLTIEQSLTYNPLTFPKIQTRWSRQHPKGPLVGIVATVSGENVGLVLAEVFATQPNTPPEAEVISLFVLPPYRHQGIGTGLMQNLEAGLRTLNCTRMKLAYKSSSTTTLALEPLLKRQHWQDPTVNFVLGKTTTQKVSQAPWLHKYPLSDKFTVFPWSELTDADRQHIQTLDYPTSLSPFGNTPAEPLNSLGLRYDGQLVGWMVTHRVATDAIRYSTMFVDKRFQRLGRGISLLSESIRRQASSGVPYCLFAVAEDNSAMQRFIHRHLEAYLTELSESRVGVKVLFY
jgi:predicted O-linked N-acetylglucosamine transferase (SPINDLY family)/GNAT superfamily N-acetyltransferase